MVKRGETQVSDLEQCGREESKGGLMPGLWPLSPVPALLALPCRDNVGEREESLTGKQVVQASKNGP